LNKGNGGKEPQCPLAWLQKAMLGDIAGKKIGGKI